MLYALLLRIAVVGQPELFRTKDNDYWSRDSCSTFFFSPFLFYKQYRKEFKIIQEEIKCQIKL